MTEETKIIYLHETPGESIKRDAGTAAMCLFLWSVGHWAESAALEWTGVAFGAVFCFLRAVAMVSGTSRMTPTEAREWLARKFPEEGQ